MSDGEAEDEGGQGYQSDDSSDSSKSRILPSGELPDYSVMLLPPGRGAKGSFSPVQKAIIERSYMPKWMEFSRSNPRKRAVSEWKKKAISEILKLPQFKGLDKSISRASWKGVSLYPSTVQSLN